MEFYEVDGEHSVASMQAKHAGSTPAAKAARPKRRAAGSPRPHKEQVRRCKRYCYQWRTAMPAMTAFWRSTTVICSPGQHDMTRRMPVSGGCAGRGGPCGVGPPPGREHRAGRRDAAHGPRHRQLRLLLQGARPWRGHILGWVHSSFGLERLLLCPALAHLQQCLEADSCRHDVMQQLPMAGSDVLPCSATHASARPPARCPSTGGRQAGRGGAAAGAQPAGGSHGSRRGAPPESQCAQRSCSSSGAYAKLSAPLPQLSTRCACMQPLPCSRTCPGLHTEATGLHHAISPQMYSHRFWRGRSFQRARQLPRSSLAAGRQQSWQGALEAARQPQCPQRQRRPRLLQPRH